MIEAIGLFHFVEHYDRPIECLASALSAAGNLSGSLIVLPEAFNNGRFYEGQPRMSPELDSSDTVDALVLLARQHSLVFIAGILSPPYNVSVLIWHNGRKLVSYKKSDDGTGNYWLWNGPDPENPISIDGVRAGVLLCNEVDDAENLTRRLDQHQNVRRVICVPACMSSAYFSGDRMVYDHWRGKYVVLANSRRDGCGSFITNTKGEKVVQFGDPHRRDQVRNRIICKSWPELDGADYACSQKALSAN